MGSVGDTIWCGLVVTATSPVGTDAFIAVAGPFVVGP